MQGASSEEPLWVFGYGSLVWRAGFDAAAATGGVCVRSQRRVFHQGSTDHRGTPEAPGRVVTLVEDAAVRAAAHAAQRSAAQQQLSAAWGSSLTPACV